MKVLKQLFPDVTTDDKGKQFLVDPFQVSGIAPTCVLLKLSSMLFDKWFMYSDELLPMVTGAGAVMRQNIQQVAFKTSVESPLNQE